MGEKKNFYLLLLSVLLTTLTGVLGAIPLRALRQKSTSVNYWLTVSVVSGVLFATQLYQIGAVFLALGLVIGVYSDLQLSGHSFLNATLTAISVTFLLIAGGTILLQAFHVFSIKPFVEAQVGNYIQVFAPNDKEMQKELLGAVITQLPSYLLILLSMSLFISFIMEKRLSKWLKHPLDHKLIHNMYQFRLPDIFVWIAIFAVFGSFYQWPEGETYKYFKIFSNNMLNTLVLFYFFQGLAVMSCFFKIFKISLLWRVIWFALAVLQLFLFVSLLGFLDFWFNFRLKIVKAAAKAQGQTRPHK